MELSLEVQLTWLEENEESAGRAINLLRCWKVCQDQRSALNREHGDSSRRRGSEEAQAAPERPSPYLYLPFPRAASLGRMAATSPAGAWA